MDVRVIDHRGRGPVLLGLGPWEGDDKDTGGAGVNAHFPQVLLREGTCGPAVSLWQNWLRLLGRGVDVSGRFDTATHDATAYVQKMLGVDVDGIVGSQTRAAAHAQLVRLRVRIPSEPTATAAPCTDDGGGGSSNSLGLGELFGVTDTEALMIGAGLLLVLVVAAKR